MALLLCIETSTTICSVSLHEEEQLLASFELHTDKSHAEALTLLIEQLFIRCGLQMHELSGIAISKGPGSFTGLRIGTAVAKGLCYALDKPLIAVNTLELMAAGIAKLLPPGDYFLCPMLDARRMEVYCALYNQALEISMPTDAIIINEHSFEDFLKQKSVFFFGDGALKCKPVLGYSPNATFIPDFYPVAKYMGKLALKRFREENFEDIAYFEPFYLKEFFMRSSK